MSNRLKTFFILSALFLCLPFIVSAHNPRIVKNGESVLVQNPEISQAFYSELKGKAQIFEIDSDKDFNLYVGVLVPKLPEANKGMSAEIYRSLESDMELITALDGTRYNWTEFYEPFGGDDYWKGPEMRQSVPAGKYVIRVFGDQENKGKYSLAIGETEYFSAKEIWNTFVTLPILKQYFFNKNPLMMFWNYLGLGLLVVIVIIALVIYLIKNNPVK